MTETLKNGVEKSCQMFPAPALSAGVSLQCKKGVFHKKTNFLYIEYIAHSQYFTCWYYTALSGLLFRISLGLSV